MAVHADPAFYLLQKARAWRRQRARVLLCEGSLRLLCWAIALLTIALWVDRFYLPSQYARLAFWFSGLAALAAGLYALLLKPWLGNRWELVLGEAARVFPNIRPYLLSAWELSRGVPEHTSSQLTRRHIDVTENLLAALPQQPAFRWRPSRHLGRIAVAAAVCALTWPWLARASWERVLAPWRDTPLERFIMVEPGSAVCTLGQPATILARATAAVGGPHHPGETSLWIRTSGAWRAAAWERQLPGAAAFTAATVTEPLQYRLTWRSLESRVYKLDPQPFPQLESLRARIFGQSAQIALTGAEPLAVRRGTWVEIHGRPNQALARAALTASFLPAPQALKCAAGGDCQAGFLAGQDGSFQFDLQTPDGRRDPAPVAYALKALIDEPPAAELLSPAQPVQASPSSVIPVAYSARDDSALSRVTLLVQLSGRADREIELQRFGRGPPHEAIGDYPWDLSGLPAGSKARFRIKAYDDCVPAQSGVSQEGSLEIVDFEAGHDAALRNWQKAEAAVKNLAEREERLSERYASGDSASAQNLLEGLPDAWRDSAAAMNGLSQAMNEDAYANPGLNERFSALAEQLQKAQSRDLPAALNAGRQGDAAAAALAHRRLAETARRAQKALEKGRSIQNLQDFFMQAGRMSQDGERIASALETMSEGRKGRSFPAEALRRVQDALKRIQERVSALQKSISELPQAAPGGREAKARRGYTMPLMQARTSADALQAALRSGDYAMAAAIARELAQQLSAIESALTAAASSAAASAPDRKGSSLIKSLQSRWSEVAEGQARLVEESQKFEAGRREKFLAGQKDLLAKLAAEETALVSSAAARGADFPAEALSAMKAAREEFKSGKVSRAPELSREAVSKLREDAKKFPNRAAAMKSFASAQEEIGRRLAQAPSAPPPQLPGAETAAAARRQAQVRQKASELHKEIENLDNEFGVALPGAAQKLESAQEEQGAAESDFGSAETAGALGHQAKALEFLEEGAKDLERAASNEQKLEISIDSGFSMSPGGVRLAPGGGGQKGVRLEFVPLPTAKDYQPPKELREELERSLKERRPAAYDAIIKEYFKRISQ